MTTSMAARRRPEGYLYSIGELCELSGYCAKTVRSWIRSGDLAALRLGREYRVSDEAWRQFTEARSVRAPQDQHEQL